MILLQVIAIVGLVSALSSACIYATIFIAAEPDFYCFSSASGNESLKEAVNINNSSASARRLSLDESCEQWANESTESRCEFDKTYYDRTIITEWHLICDQHYKASLTQTIHILGSIFGVCSGVLGDRFGRRDSVLVFSCLLALTLLLSQLLLSFDSSLPVLGANDTKYIIYSASQFLIGFLVNCLYCTAYVLLMEFTTENFRTKIANLNSYIYVLGELIVLVVYYVSRNWHVLNWFIGLYSLFLFGKFSIYLFF